MAIKILHKCALGTLPLLDAASATSRERELGRVGDKSANTFLVMCQDARGLACRKIPEADGRIERRANDLGIGLLTPDLRNSGGVSGQDNYIASRSHVPDARNAISTPSDEDIEGWM